MSEVNCFEVSTRKKDRFATKRGQLPVEDLWDLPLKSQNGVSLDAVGREIKRAIRDLEEESLIDTPSTELSELQRKLDVVLHIIKTKQDENKTKLEAEERKRYKREVQEALSRKKLQQLDNRSVEDLEKELANL